MELRLCSKIYGRIHANSILEFNILLAVSSSCHPRKLIPRLPALVSDVIYFDSWPCVSIRPAPTKPKLLNP